MNVRLEKIKRLRRGEPPRVVDLFAGCGGLSLGFHSLGFSIVGAVEIDPIAAESHANNFFRHLSDEEKEIHRCPRDMTEVSPRDLVEELRLAQSVETAVDIIIGGPPCQAFARVGRAKLREVASHPDAYLRDPRANLYIHYLDYVKEMRPIVILMENVPDILNYGGHNIANEMCEVLDDMGYECKYTLLNAAYYGVPQMRERMFLLAYARELGLTPEFPAPTHWVELPRGYEGTRQSALKTVDSGKLFEKSYFANIPLPSGSLPPAITAREAIGDLPKITYHLEGKLKRGARRFDELIPYPDDEEISEYAKLMRNWPGFENHTGVRDHVIRYLPRDYAIFRRMNPGDQYPEAYQHALMMFHEHIQSLKERGTEVVEGTEQWLQIKKSIVPPYDPSKFPNKWRKMEPDLPARTLMAHLGKDGYSHIHYDSEQARTISVREAARLQSFPDGFVFAGTMNSAFRQIGNAVPPLLAARLAERILLDVRRC